MYGKQSPIQQDGRGLFRPRTNPKPEMNSDIVPKQLHQPAHLTNGHLDDKLPCRNGTTPHYTPDMFK
jgi:hypothetical protein